MVRLVLASTAIKYAKHVAGELAFRLGEHRSQYHSHCSKPAIPAFFQTGMSSQPPQHLSEPMVSTIPSIAPCLVLAPFSPDSRDEWSDIQSIKIGYSSLKQLFCTIPTVSKIQNYLAPQNMISLQRAKIQNWQLEQGRKTETLNTNVFNSRWRRKVRRNTSSTKSNFHSCTQTLCDVQLCTLSPTALTCAQVLSPWDCSTGNPLVLWPQLKGCSQTKHIKTVIKERWLFPRNIYLNSAGFYKATTASWQKQPPSALNIIHKEL